MKSVFRSSGPVLAVLLFVLAVFPAGAQNVFSAISWSFRGSMLFFTEDNDLQSDPMPILPSFGVAAAYPIFGPLWAELSLDFYGTHYGYNYEIGRAVPYAEENRSTLVIGNMLGIQALAKFQFGNNFDIRVYGGPAADLRICLIAEDLKNDDKKDASKQTKDVSKYFWSMGRWFYPVLGFGMDFGITPKTMLGFDARVWFPLYKTWTGEDLPLAEGWRIGIGILLTIR
jgi:hypothetical protein